MTSVDGWSTPDPGSPPDSPFPHVFRSVTLGTMKLRNRIMLPPHGSAIGNLLHGYGAETAGNYRSAMFVERVLADGHADVVGMARAYIAEPAILTKARAGQARQIRPYVGGNDCISQYMEGLPFGCAVR